MIDNVDPKKVGYRIREIRKELGLSMAAFAEKIDNKSKSGTVSNWETGKNLPNNERLKKIAEIGKISIDELLLGSIREQIFDIISRYCSENNFEVNNMLINLIVDDYNDSEINVADEENVITLYSSYSKSLSPFTEEQLNLIKQAMLENYTNDKKEIDRISQSETKEFQEINQSFEGLNHEYASRLNKLNFDDFNPAETKAISDFVVLMSIFNNGNSSYAVNKKIQSLLTTIPQLLTLYALNDYSETKNDEMEKELLKAFKDLIGLISEFNKNYLRG